MSGQPIVSVDRQERRQGVPVDREERRQGVPVDRDTRNQYEMLPGAEESRVAERRGHPGDRALLDSPRARRWHAWIDRIADGDLDACAAFYDESASLAFGVLMQLLHRRDAAEDALVELYLEIRLRAQRREHRGRNPVAWMVSLARRVAAARATARLHRRRLLVAFDVAG